MRRLTILVLVLAGIYAGYWVVGVNALKSGIQEAIAKSRADGWELSYASLETVGFPSRFDTTATDLAVAPPTRAFTWKIPILQVFALSYQPNNVIAAFSPEQSFQVGDQVFEVQAEGLRASAGVRASPDLPFNAATIEMGPTSVSSSLGWQMALQRALLAARAAPEVENQYDLYADANGLALPPEVVAQLGLPDVIESISAEALVTFDQPLDRNTVDPVIQAITLKDFDLSWADINLKADGELQIDDAGFPMGQISLRTAQWKRMVELAVDAGAIPQRAGLTIGNVAGAMAGPDGTLDLPIAFRNRLISLGPVPLGPAPRLR